MKIIFNKEIKTFGVHADRARFSPISSNRDGKVKNVLNKNSYRNEQIEDDLVDTSLGRRSIINRLERRGKVYEDSRSGILYPVPTKSKTPERVDKFDSIHNPNGVIQSLRYEVTDPKDFGKISDTVHHYTPSKNIKSISEIGLKSGSNNEISAFPDNYDYIDKSQLPFNKSILPLSDHAGGFRSPYRSLVARQTSLLDGDGGIQNNNDTFVRVVADTNGINKRRVKRSFPHEIRFKDEIPADKLKFQLPIGSVTKNNYQDYIKDLKDVDPSKFDVSDKYTRRIYNLYAKKNNLPLLPGSERFSIIFDQGTKSFSMIKLG